MPKTPILSREGFYKTSLGGTLVPLDWNLINTNLGVMLEQRQMGPARNPLKDIDAIDAGFTRFADIDEHRLQFLFSTGGSALPTNFSLT